MARDPASTPQKGNAPSPPNGLPFTTEILEALWSLTDRQRSFVLNYVYGAEGLRNNGSASARAAGFAPKQAGAQAHQLLHMPKIKHVMNLLRVHAAQQVELNFNNYLQLLLQQANSWLTPEGKPKEEPLVSAGAVVTYDRVLYEKDGVTPRVRADDTIMTFEEPVITQWRPNASNTRALEIIGVALGYVQPKGPTGGGGGPVDPGNAADSPTAGYGEERLDKGQLTDFLDHLPSPDALQKQLQGAPAPGGGGKADTVGEEE